MVAVDIKSDLYALKQLVNLDLYLKENFNVNSFKNQH